MYTTTFVFKEGNPFITQHRPIALEVYSRLKCKAMRICEAEKKQGNRDLIVYSKIPPYITEPTTIQVIWDLSDSE